MFLGQGWEEMNMFKSFMIKMIWASAFLAIFSLKFVDVSIGKLQNEYPLEAGWKAVGLPLQAVETETWLQFNKQWMSVYELKQLISSLQNKLGIITHSKPTYGEQDGMTYASLEGKTNDNTSVIITIQSMITDNSSETQLGVNTNHDGGVANLIGYVSGMKNRIMAIGKEPHFKVLLFGEYKGKLAQNVIKEFSSRVFNKIKAELVDSSYEAGNSTQKGFSKLIPDQVTYDSKQMNIEIGTRYDRERNITQIVLASPNLSDGT
ncbi:MAG TPA: hypothetical protein DDW65_09800 [Firmicutes bacterium]|jgi:hypothetical protein|nr:hypothetical protein [Bacillota bacterium]